MAPTLLLLMWNVSGNTYESEQCIDMDWWEFEKEKPHSSLPEISLKTACKSFINKHLKIPKIQPGLIIDLNPCQEKWWAMAIQLAYDKIHKAICCSFHHPVILILFDSHCKFWNYFEHACVHASLKSACTASYSYKEWSESLVTKIENRYKERELRDDNLGQ